MNLPSGLSDASLVLTRGTLEEQVSIWKRTQPSWGPSYTPEAYIARERLLLTFELTKDGGLECWILTDANAAAAERPVLSSCETYRKKALARDADGSVRDVTSYGIASVFTYEEHRRKGYAGKMLSLLGEELAKKQDSNKGDSEFSILFSDIGNKYYAGFDWLPFPSTHLSTPTRPFTTPYDDCLTLITDDNLRMVAELDEKTLRAKIASPPSDPHKVRVAVVPDFATYQWHMIREDFMCKHAIDKGPTVHGAIYTPKDAPTSRVWALWSTILYGGKEKPEINVMNFLRFAVEDDNISDEELSKAIKAIMGLVHTNAQEWLCPKVDMWNPEPRTRRLIENMTELNSTFVEREKTNITSFRWFGEGPVSEVEWVANEKFEWC